MRPISSAFWPERAPRGSTRTKADVIAALLVFRLFYLLLPFAASIIVVLLFERARLAKAWRDRMPSAIPAGVPPPDAKPPIAPPRA